MAGTVAPNIVTDGLVLYLDAANPNSYISGSTTWRNMVGSNNGTLINGPTYNSANGGSIVFDGSNDYVDMSPYYYNNVTQHTAIVLFKTYNKNSFWGEILQKGQRNDFAIRQYSSLGRLEFRYITNNATYSYDAFSLENNVWYMAAMSINTQSGGTFKCYINGTQIYNTSITTPTVLSQNITYAGQLIMGRILPGNEWLSGEIPIAMMYDRQLTDIEIQQNFNSTKTRFGL